MTTQEYIESADDELALIESDALTLDEYIEIVQNQPSIASHSVKYILEAIEYYGTRTVFEDGKEKERYVFFDDPHGNAEHAILGNTDVLNDFVNELRRMASDSGKNERIIWFCGPTASGKSELKRCLISGIGGYAQTEEGSRYTLEWSLDSLMTGGMTYGENSTDKTWYKSPINIHPLSVFPEETRREVLNDINESEAVPVDVQTDIDPFSQEAFETLSEEYDSFKDIVSSDHLRVKKYIPEVGDGIGVLHAEDVGKPKEKLIGGWMEGAMDNFESRGRKNAQAFSYDGVLCQGNSGISIIEDAGHHSNVLDKMMNVCEEKMMKLDNKIAMDLDTLLFIISNPDLEEQLSQHSDAGQADPLRALRRRLDQYDLNYLTTLSLEVMLIRRLLMDSNEMWYGGEDRMEKVREPLEINGTEIAPHVLEAVGVYEISTRLCSVSSSIDPVSKVMLFELGEFENEEGETYNIEQIDVDVRLDGDSGIPVTYSIDVIVDMVQENDVILPEDMLDALEDNLGNDALFVSGEISHFANMAFDVKKYILSEQADDVLDAMVGDIEVSEEDVQEYVDGIYAWQDNDEEEFDSFELMEFETRYLGVDRDEYGEKATPSPYVQEFRDNIVYPINQYYWNERDEGFEVDDVPLSQSPNLRPLLQENDWSTVRRVYPDVDFAQWRDPPSDTETEELKEKTIRRMQENMDYSEQSAETASIKVIETVAMEVEI